MRDWSREEREDVMRDKAARSDAMLKLSMHSCISWWCGVSFWCWKSKDMEGTYCGGVVV